MDITSKLKEDRRFDIAVLVFDAELGSLLKIDVKPSGRFRVDEFIGKFSRLFKDSTWGAIRHLCVLQGTPIFYDERKAQKDLYPCRVIGRPGEPPQKEAE